MKRLAWSLPWSLALLAAAGCTVGLPHGPIQPTPASNFVDQLSQEWLGTPPRQQKVVTKRPDRQIVPAACVEGEPEPADDCAQACADPECCVAGRCCPLLPHPAPQPPYIDPGPPGRFFPVPVRPVFAPQPLYPELAQPMPVY